MSIPDYAGYVQRLNSPINHFVGHKATTTITVGRPNSLWLIAPESGAAPTTAAVPTNNTKGALGTLAANQPSILDGTNQRILSLGTNNGSVIRSGLLWVYDRLSHQGGLNATVTTVGATTNLPTAALTRYTTGAGVWIMVEIYTQIGTTATTITCTYTNDAGTGGRVTPLTDIGGTARREVNRGLILPLQAGDTGVRSIESYTLTATTGTAGAFGFTLMKPLAFYPLCGIEQSTTLGLFNCANLPVVEDGACLQMIVFTPNVGTGAITYDMALAED